MSNKSKKIVISIIAIIIAVFIVIFIINNNKNSSTVNIEEVKKLNEKLDEYYLARWKDEQFVSYFSYLANSNFKEVTLQDLEDKMKIDFDKSIEKAQIHFVKPKALKPYLKGEMLDKDLEILTVYSAIPVKDGMFISSKYDKGAVLSNKEYKEFILSHNWDKGKIRNITKDDEEYNKILKPIQNKYKDLINANVKHMVFNDKYGVVVIGNQNIIKEFAMRKNDDGNYDIIVDNLEKLPQKIYVNYSYLDFDLSMLPLYQISDYKIISSNVNAFVNALIENGDITKNDKKTYGLRAGNFVYLEFELGKKMLLYINDDGVFDVYEVDNFKTAISQMTKLEKNPPVFIINFE